MALQYAALCLFPSIGGPNLQRQHHRAPTHLVRRDLLLHQRIGVINSNARMGNFYPASDQKKPPVSALFQPLEQFRVINGLGPDQAQVIAFM